jgi:hypothetical protein
MKKLLSNSGFYLIILIPFVFLGFYKPYFSQFPNFEKKITLIVHFHAACLSCWVLLLIVQPLLIRYKKLKIHRGLGKFTYFLAPVILVSIAAMIFRSISLLPKPASTQIILNDIFLPVIDSILFTIFYILAVINKKDIQKHSSYMIATGLIFINPSVARIGGFWFHMPSYISLLLTVFFIDIITACLLLFFKKKGLNYRSFATVLILFLIYHITTAGLIYFGHWFQ